MINSIIVDDEESILEEIADTLKNYKDLNIIGIYTNPEEALKIVKKADIQLVFLDIEMPYINGISLSKKMIYERPNIEIVFITAYNQYALDAFDADAIDYILKPIREERIEKCIKKVLKVIKNVDKPENILEVKCFKKFRVYIGDEIIKWRTYKDLELFAYLLENASVPIHKEKIVEDVWSGIELKVALGYLQSSVYRIRKKFAEFGFPNSIIYVNSSYGVNLVNIRYELWDHYRLIKNDYIIEEKNIKTYEKLVDNYIGDYLEDDGFLWSISTQQVLRQKQEKLIIKLGEYFIDREAYIKAVNVLERILKINPLSDEGIKLLLTAYSLSSSSINLEKYYADIRDLIRREYDTDISRDIKKHYEHINRSIYNFKARTTF